LLSQAIALQEKTAKQQAEALLQKYRDRFGDISK
jgi:ribosomal protein S17E